MSDVISELRDIPAHTLGCPDDCPLCLAVAEIERLTAENRAMREAIQGALDNCSPAFLGINVELSAFQELRKIAASTQQEHSDE